MNRALKRGLILTLATLGGAGAVLGQAGCYTMSASASGQETAQAEPFYYDLAPYGEWVFVSPWGWVWQPGFVDSTFMPYASEGHWVLTSYGWVFESTYPWAPIAYHYGRWVHHVRLGWLWWPDTAWSPAWVAWHCGGGYTGWRPLGWREGGRFGRGHGDHDRDREGRDHRGDQEGRPLDPIALDARQPWSFVETVHFTEPKVAAHIVPMERVPDLVDRGAERAEPILGTSFGTGFGPAPGTVAAATGRELPTQAIRVPPSPPMRSSAEVPTAHVPLSRQHSDPMRPPVEEGRIRAFNPPASRPPAAQPPPVARPAPSYEPAPSYAPPAAARPAPSYAPPPAMRPAPAPSYAPPAAARPAPSYAPPPAMRPAPSYAPPAAARPAPSYAPPAAPRPPPAVMRPASPAPPPRAAPPPSAMRPSAPMSRPSMAAPPAAAAAPNDPKKKKR